QGRRDDKGRQPRRPRGTGRVHGPPRAPVPAGGPARELAGRGRALYRDGARFPRRELMEPRLTAGLRVAALLRRADLAGRGAYVIHRGDDTAGAICLTVVRPGGGAELWGQEYDPLSDSRPWVMQAV